MEGLANELLEQAPADYDSDVAADEIANEPPSVKTIQAGLGALSRVSS